MRGTVVKALRKEAQAQDVLLKKLKRNFMKLNHKERGGMRALLGVYAATRGLFWTTPA